MVLDGNDSDSPILNIDNVTVTENYAYLQEDPNALEKPQVVKTPC